MRTKGTALAGALTGVLSLGLSAWAGGAAAQAVDAAAPETVLAAVQAYGHKARLETDEEGFPVVRARVNDINYGIHFYGCDDAKLNCRQLQIASSFDVEPGLTTDFVNQWNEDWAIGRLSVDANGDPLFTYFLATDGGLPPENFRAVMDLWTNALLGVVEDVGY